MCHAQESREDLARFVQEPGAQTRLKCRYTVWAPKQFTGISNQMLSALSFFIYSLLTHRIFLIDPDDASLAGLFCEPFPRKHPGCFQLQGSWYLISDLTSIADQMNVKPADCEVGVLRWRQSQHSTWTCTVASLLPSAR